MSLPPPAPGLVISYAFLWPHEAEAGAEEGRKARPCAIVVATRADPDGDLMTIVAPVTHRPPGDPATAIELPAEVKARLGLDGERSWVRLDCLNRFAWPGYDLRPRPGGGVAYGRLPEALWDRIRQGILELNRARQVRTVPR